MHNSPPSVHSTCFVIKAVLYPLLFPLIFLSHSLFSLIVFSSRISLARSVVLSAAWDVSALAHFSHSFGHILHVSFLPVSYPRTLPASFPLPCTNRFPHSVCQFICSPARNLQHTTLPLATRQRLYQEVSLYFPTTHYVWDSLHLCLAHCSHYSQRIAVLSSYRPRSSLCPFRLCSSASFRRERVVFCSLSVFRT